MALIQERNAISLNMEELTTLIYSYTNSNVPLSRIRQIRDKMAKIPDLSLSISRYNDSREDAINRSLRFGRAVRKFIKDERLSADEFWISYENHNELVPAMSQYGFFLPSLILQSDEKQQEEWVSRIENSEITGSYAQTELGHGSNVRGIEITATYDHGSKSFVLNSPTVSATKWWIGALGLTSNHTLLIAQLIINGTNYGPHPFLVPLRDIETHEPFPGVDVGDIGPKIGMHSNDNGYLRFENYRIDKKYLLRRTARINDNGEYEIIKKKL